MDGERHRGSASLRAASLLLLLALLSSGCELRLQLGNLPAPDMSLVAEQVMLTGVGLLGGGGIGVLAQDHT